MRNSGIFMVSIITIIVLLGGCATKAVRQDQMTADKVITDIVAADNTVEITANGTFSYTVYKPADPYRITIDIPEVGTGAFKDRIVPKSSAITEIIPSQIETPKMASRIEILLQNPADIEPVYQGNTLRLTVKEAKIPATDGAKSFPEEKIAAKDVREDPPAVAAEGGGMAMKDSAPVVAEAPAVSKQEGSAAIVQKATEIQDLRLESADGQVKLIIKGNGAMTPSVFTLKNRIVVDIPEVTLRAKVPSTVFAPVKGLRAGKHKDRTRLVIDLKEAKGFDVSSDGNSIIVSIAGGEVSAPREPERETQRPLIAERHEAPVQKPLRAEQGEKRAGAAAKAPVAVSGETVEAREPELITEGRYTGKKISLDFQDADIVPIFRLLSDISGYNIIVNPEVKGKLTMKLINVPWDQALDLILKTFSLGKAVDGNIIRIAPLSVFAKESEERTRAREAEVKAELLETRIYPVSYADVAVVEKALKDSKIISARGSVSIDKRTSAIVVKDVPSTFPQIDNLLITLDKPIPQVLIEARIVEVSTTSARDLGIQWGVKLSAMNTLSALGGAPALGAGAFTGNKFMVDFPAAIGPNSGSGFSFGLLNPARTLGLDLQLSALEQVGTTKIISNPRIVTTDNEKATIMQGTSEPYPQIDTQSGQISAAFKDVAILAEVTPHITPAGSVNMTVLVKKEDIIGTVNIAGSPVPRTSKIEGNAKVLVQNGETLVIGGVYKKTEKRNASGLPWLMNLPVVGWMFKDNSTSEDVSELMIFITPRIVEK
jgi:type IV pilus assembly protein PilQ